ncbi:hypothetical protein EGJ54_24490 [Pandoraea apista]|nr:hypothetical protein EGJ54_24490 [Pandoraea apista]RRW98083.1 hypothetical protein EGJ56_23900 [Pandoraea apista]
MQHKCVLFSLFAAVVAVPMILTTSAANAAPQIASPKMAKFARDIEPVTAAHRQAAHKRKHHRHRHHHKNIRAN